MADGFQAGKSLAWLGGPQIERVQDRPKIRFRTIGRIARALADTRTLDNGPIRGSIHGSQKHVQGLGFRDS